MKFEKSKILSKIHFKHLNKCNMPIPDNIKREHIFQAMLRIQKEGIPKKREARDWIVSHDGVNYPCKLRISWANIYANREELNPNPNNFTSHMAIRHLEDLGFMIVSLS